MFNKRAILLSCFLILSLNYYSQSYFNKRFDVANKSNLNISFKFYNDTFYIPTAIAETPSPNLCYTSSLLKIDLLGNVVNQKRFKNTNQYYTSSLDVVKLKNSYYQCGNTGSGTQDISSLLKFSENGDTIYTHIYGDTSYSVNTTKIIPYTKTKNQLLVIGVTDSTCGPGHQGLYRPIVRVIDTNGILLQTNLYLSTTESRNIIGIDTSENKGFLIGYYSTSGTWGFESRLMKLDSNLNFVWDKKMTETGSGFSGIANHENQYYFQATTIVDSIWNFTYKWDRPALSKVALNGSILWQKYYGIKQQDIDITGLTQCNNGDLILCGSRRVSNNELKGFIIRTDSIGNQKWWKEYRPNTTPILDTLAENYLYDIMELPNGDIAAVGWAGGTSLNPLQQTWLLKVDSNGCFGIGNCPPNITTGINELSSNDEFTLKVFPNPFTNHITVSYNLHNTNKSNVEINLINMVTGQIITKQTSTKNEDVIDFNTENLANGVYMISLSNKNVNIGNVKVIKIQ
jgi:hypothetical protein